MSDTAAEASTRPSLVALFLCFGALFYTRKRAAGEAGLVDRRSLTPPPLAVGSEKDVGLVPDQTVGKSAAKKSRTRAGPAYSAQALQLFYENFRRSPNGNYIADQCFLCTKPDQDDGGDQGKA